MTELTWISSPDNTAWTARAASGAILLVEQIDAEYLGEAISQDGHSVIASVAGEDRDDVMHELEDAASPEEAP
jgi:hypothetical protein